MGDFHNQWYSDVIVYDERKRYFYTWARKNKPHLDDEIRNESIANVDMIRRSIQHSFGGAGTPEGTYSSYRPGATNAFKVLAASVANGGSGTQNRNFLIKGGAADQQTKSNTEHPAVLFARGFYIFLRGNLEYVNQNNLGDYVDNNYTETLIPDLTDPAPGQERVDVVYVDLHFAEASAVTGTDASDYTDTNLKNPIVGTETASRARAVFDIRVWEDWRFKKLDGSGREIADIETLRIDENIFDSYDFLGSLDDALQSDPNPVNHHYRIPIAVLYRRGAQNITDDDIIDLLELYNRRIFTQQEVTHRLSHGGFTSKEVTESQLNSAESGYSGLFSARWSYAKIDEGAYATGANEGLGSEAFNTNSVTPRVLDTYGQYAMDGLLVGGATGIPTGPLDSVTGPVDLHPGELVANEISAKSIYVGYNKGLSGNRGYSDRFNVHMQGITGAAGIAVINDTHETGAVSFRITGAQHYTHVDYQGRHGIDTPTPGWTGPESVWNTDRYSGDDIVEIVHDNAESARVQKHLFVGKDMYIARDAYGKTWVIPSVINRDNPALLGFTGIPQTGVSASPASFQVVPGIAVVGATGTVAGYTGPYGFYEAYDPDHTRVFTIGSRGIDFDRQVLSLYGTSPRDCWVSDADFTDLPGNLVSTPLTVGDTVSYVIQLTDGSYVTGAVSGVTGSGEIGLQEVADHINYIGGFCETGISYQYYKAKEAGDTGAATIITKTDGVRKGAEVNYEGEQDSQYLRIVVKSMPEINLSVDDVNMYVFRAGTTPTMPGEHIDFVEAGYYGSGLYGGDIVDMNFVKMDLGEAADAWLFNGDVFFNGDGLLNRVTFSPNVVFRDDVFIYGKLSAQELLLSTATITDLNVDRNAGIADYLAVNDGFALGYTPFTLNGFNTLNTMLNNPALSIYHLLGTVNGGMRMHNVFLSGGVEENYADRGVIWALNTTNTSVGVRVVMNGTHNDSDWPFGIHLIDSRSISESSKFSTFVMDAHDYQGDPPALRDFKLWVKGDLELGVIEGGLLTGGSALMRRLTLGEGATQVNSAYTFYLQDGNAYISNLTVQSLRYDVENPAGESTFYEPQNIKTVQPVLGEQTFNKNEGILRIKQFSLDISTKPPAPPAVLRNKSQLGTDTSYDDFSSGKGLWAHDTLSFSREVVEEFSKERGNNTITSDQDFNVRTITASDITKRSIDKWEYYRNNFSRIILMKLGTVKMVWKGFSATVSQGGSGNAEIANFVDSGIVTNYQFSSSLFKFNEQGSNVFDWKNSAPQNVNMAKVDGSFNDQIFASNLLYNFVGSIGLYLPLNRWTAYEDIVTRNGDTFYERFVYFRYNRRVQNYHSIDVNRQTDLSDWGLADSPPARVIGDWEVAVYPKIIQQKIYGQAEQGSNANSDELYYETLWDLNLVLYPLSTGGCNNLVGKVEISYM